MIFGLCGYNASGKGEIANILKEKGYVYFSLSDIIREECEKRDLEKNRENLVAIGNEFREKRGANYFAEMILKKINLERNNNKNFIVDSIRNPKEVETLRQDKEFVLIGINAPIELRFSRSQSRGRNENALTLEEFIKQEEKEKSSKENAQQLDTVYKMADKYIYNDGSLEELKQRLDFVLNNERKKRPNWDKYFMNIAEVVATRASCLRRNVGCVLVKDKQIIATGYNGPPKGHPTCDELGGCLRDITKTPSGQRFEISRAVHAEQNAISQAAENGISTKGATLYCTTYPCVLCIRTIINAGVKKVIYKEFYPDDGTTDIARRSGLEMVQFKD